MIPRTLCTNLVSAYPINLIDFFIVFSDYGSGAKAPGYLSEELRILNKEY